MSVKLRKVGLEKWAASKFEDPPCRETLRRWVRNGRIYPAPVKVGRAYLVSPEAEYIDPSDIDSLVRRIINESAAA